MRGTRILAIVSAAGAIAAGAPRAQAGVSFAQFTAGQIEFDGSSFWKEFPEIPIAPEFNLSAFSVTASGGTSSGPSGDDPFVMGTSQISATITFGEGFTNVVMTGHGKAEQAAGASAGAFPGGLNFRAFAGDNGFGGDNNLTPLVLVISEEVGYDLEFTASGDFAAPGFSQITLVDQFDTVISGSGTLLPGEYRILFDFGLDLNAGQPSDVADFTWTLSLVPGPSALALLAAAAAFPQRRRRRYAARGCPCSP
jgi:hypothetical protein